ncbi:MAG: hypothetical protein CMQ11_16640 [Gammaproteobacteria bacterium]|nr:hypothetical protein [Gammaproteobacteria bacterium]
MLVFVLSGLLLSSLSSCTAIAVTSAVATAAKAVVILVKLPVKVAISLASSDDEEDQDEVRTGILTFSDHQDWDLNMKLDDLLEQGS